MADGSKIEWTDATWNPVTGCTKVSAGCKHCYAERDWARLAAPRATPNAYTGRAFTDVRVRLDRIEQPLAWTKPRRVFVNSMSDLFHEDVSDAFLDTVFQVILQARQHVFQVLTKRPARMLAYVTGRLGFVPPNVWLGVSVEDQAAADERIPLLLATPAAVRWVSAEPLLGPVDLSGWFDDGSNHMALSGVLNWCVVGGESGPKARPMHPDWVRSLRDQCAASRGLFFFKQWGEWARSDQCGLASVAPIRYHRWADGSLSERFGKRHTGRLLDGRTWDEYPEVVAS